MFFNRIKYDCVGMNDSTELWIDLIIAIALLLCYIGEKEMKRIIN